MCEYKETKKVGPKGRRVKTTLKYGEVETKPFLWFLVAPTSTKAAAKKGILR